MWIKISCLQSGRKQSQTNKDDTVVAADGGVPSQTGQWWLVEGKGKGGISKPRMAPASDMRSDASRMLEVKV